MKAKDVRTVFLQADPATLSERANAWLEANGEAEIVQIRALLTEKGEAGLFILYQAPKEPRPVGFAPSEAKRSDT